MGFLLVLSCALILYGTLYPFSLNFGLHQENVLDLLKMSVGSHVSRGDVIANILLFLPFGFFAMQRVLPRVPRLIRLLIIVVAGAAFSLGIESIQSCLPGRVVSVYDILTNTIGTLLGAVFGWKNRRGKMSKILAGDNPSAIFPVLLLVAWIGCRLFPFVPTLDVQNVKNALKPLFFGGFSPLDALKSFIITMVVCCLVRNLTKPGGIRTALTFLPLGVMAVKPFIIGGAISQAEIFGTIPGIAAWWYILSRIPRNTDILALLLMAQIIIYGLSPFVFSSNPGHFSFIPFNGLMHGITTGNVLYLVEMIFIYGALLWLPVKTGWSLSFSLILSVFLLTGIEVMQMFQPSRIPEITDPLLAVILAIFFYFLDIREEKI